MPANHSRKISPPLIAWGIVAVMGGVGSLVLPPYFTAGGLAKPAYGWPLIPWLALAWANLRAEVSMVCFLVLGFTLGSAQPRRWFPLVGVAMTVPAVLNAINIVHDGMRDPTSHNLWPFEFLFYALVCLPTCGGAFLGAWLRRWLQRRAA